MCAPAACKAEQPSALILRLFAIFRELGFWGERGRENDSIKNGKKLFPFKSDRDLSCMKSRGVKVIQVLLYKEFFFTFVFASVSRKASSFEVFWRTPPMLLKGQNKFVLG